jgi:hypothetical protein
MPKPPKPWFVTLETNYENTDGCALTLHYKGKVTAAQVREYVRNADPDDHPHATLWVDADDECFEAVQVRKGVWQAHPTG